MTNPQYPLHKYFGVYTRDTCNITRFCVYVYIYVCIFMMYRYDYRQKMGEGVFVLLDTIFHSIA